MRRPRRYGTRARLAVRVLSAYLTAYRSIRAENLDDALWKLRDAVLSETAVRVGEEGRRRSRHLALVSERVLQPLPLDHRCLVRSLVLLRLMATENLGGSLVLGVRPGETFTAHAWVEFDGHPLLPPYAGTYERLLER